MADTKAGGWPKTGEQGIGRSAPEKALCYRWEGGHTKILLPLLTWYPHCHYQWSRSSCCFWLLLSPRVVNDQSKWQWKTWCTFAIVLCSRCLWLHIWHDHIGLDDSDSVFSWYSIVCISQQKNHSNGKILAKLIIRAQCNGASDPLLWFYLWSVRTIAIMSFLPASLWHAYKV